MNSDSGSSPSVLSGASNSSSLRLYSHCTLRELHGLSCTDRCLHRLTAVRQEGYVYTLSGRVKTHSCLGQCAHVPPSGLPYGAKTNRRSHKGKNSRALPYQKCHQAQFLDLEQDTELLMRVLKAQIHQS